MNQPIRFDLYINTEKLVAAIKAGLDPNRASHSVWWQRVEHEQLGGELENIYEAPFRQRHLSVWVLGVEYKISEYAVRRAIQILADRYPRSLGDILEEHYRAGAADRFVQCALFGEVRYA